MAIKTFLSDDLPTGQVLVGDGSNKAQPVSPSGDVGIDGSGVTTIQPGAVTAPKTGFSVGFAGNLMGTHTHQINGGFVDTPVLQPFLRLQTNTPGGPGTGVVTGSTLIQAVTLATATVVSFHGGLNKVDINTVVGTFNDVNLVTATNPDLTTNNFTPRMGALNVWNFVASTIAIFETSFDPTNGFFDVLRTNDPNVEILFSSSGQTRYESNFNQLETLLADNFISPQVHFAIQNVTSDSAGTPSGTNTIV